MPSDHFPIRIFHQNHKEPGRARQDTSVCATRSLVDIHFQHERPNIGFEGVSFNSTREVTKELQLRVSSATLKSGTAIPRFGPRKRCLNRSRTLFLKTSRGPRCSVGARESFRAEDLCAGQFARARQPPSRPLIKLQRSQQARVKLLPSSCSLP